MERKPYYILHFADSNFKLHEGNAKDVYRGGNGIQLYLTDEEVQKYNSEKIRKILKPYAEITLKRYKHLPSELIFYAIEEVIYG